MGCRSFEGVRSIPRGAGRPGPAPIGQAISGLGAFWCETSELLGSVQIGRSDRLTLSSSKGDTPALEVVLTLEFDDWLAGSVPRAKAKVLARIRNMELGNYGDCKPVGNGVSESRINWGRGLRLYFVERGNTLVVLLCGGDKSTQEADIERALELAETV
ncbi:type II toxin-antitoxin system RelE/ParE family toxin [Arenimonas sp.]|uniref:type II toxin-antitoxin system RelE/ParE family toxin n=1 Tax=Arenimonas sp. TaxID=1872635 RepID=UPI0035B2ABA4